MLTNCKTLTIRKYSAFLFKYNSSWIRLVYRYQMNKIKNLMRNMESDSRYLLQRATIPHFTEPVSSTVEWVNHLITPVTFCWRTQKYNVKKEEINDEGNQPKRLFDKKKNTYVHVEKQSLKLLKMFGHMLTARSAAVLRFTRKI